MEAQITNQQDFESSLFYLKNTFEVQIMVSLCADSIFLKSQNFQQSIHMDNTTKFTLIHKPPSVSLLRVDQSHSKQIMGFRLETQNGQNIIQLYSPNYQQILYWRQVLSSRINMLGFHQFYKTYKKIGKGTTATVYYAIRLQDQKKAAIKAFSKEFLLSQPKGWESLENEISIMRAIKHDNIIKLYEVCQTNNSIYVALEYLTGGQLHDRLNTYRFKMKEIQIILKQLLKALDYLNSKGIIHRDLKPQNIIFRNFENLEIVIADFGLATRTHSNNYIFSRCGTPGYVAPEILRTKQMEQNTISDIFSLGTIVHLFGLRRSLFAGSNYTSVLKNNKKCEIDFTGQCYKSMNQSLLDLMVKMLEISPEKRINAKQALEHPFFILEHDEAIEVQELSPLVRELSSDQMKKTKFSKMQDSVGTFVFGKSNMLKGNDSNGGESGSLMSPFTPDPKKYGIKQSRFTILEQEKSSYFKTTLKRKKSLIEKIVTLEDLHAK